MAQIEIKQTTDEVIEQVRKIKAALAESMGYDVDRILDDARRKQRESGRTVLPPPARHAT